MAEAGVNTSLELQVLSELGVLQRQVGIVQQQNQHIIAEQERAADGRRVIYEKLGTLALVEKEVARLSPLVDDHEKKHQRAIGAVSFGRVIWMMLSGSAGAGVVVLLQMLTGRGPPAH